jgi:hypothetical protein
MESEPEGQSGIGRAFADKIIHYLKGMPSADKF